MKNYLLVVFTFAILIGFNQEIKSQDCNNPDPSGMNTTIYLKIQDNVPAELSEDDSIYNYIEICDNHSTNEASGQNGITNFTSDVYKSSWFWLKKRYKVKWIIIYNGVLDIKIKDITPKSVSPFEYLTAKKNSNSGKILDFKVKRKKYPEGNTPYSILLQIDGKDHPIDPVIRYHP
ncbi:hypothetical protein [Lutimonas zeaxanthinifaciens]|uniref:hypothetical protein n=1 Tax=Lutimonas zeaxanthinifaciens TaxID=3060215 RepID=UPI00265CADEB|nr:hypothetical protein [Lutimonas sp. YSD2104]WKK65664.1 hypothetical protein QZH61_13875 [Lutimonas sp. YSD2104]